MNIKHKIIFLDIDGVLNSHTTKDTCGFYIGIEDRKVKLLRDIVDATDAKIVLSSTWRIGLNNQGHRLENNMPYLKNKLAKFGLDIYGYTPEVGIHRDCRGQEINLWLKAHEQEVDQWVVLDDEWFPDFSTYGIYPHWVRTAFYGDGLTIDDVEDAIRVLNGELLEGE